MTVFTRSNNPELTAMMSEFPERYPIRVCDWFNHWTDAESYLNFVIQQGDGWVVNCDNDCFIHDTKRLKGLLLYMVANNYTHCGMRDAGVSPHRNNDHAVMNPFFNIFNTTALKPLLAGITPVENNIEPYNAFFTHLHHHGNPLYLDAATRSDGITTHLMDHTGHYFALHSWYSREYETHKTRIKNVYHDAIHYRSLSQ